MAEEGNGSLWLARRLREGGGDAQPLVVSLWDWPKSRDPPSRFVSGPGTRPRDYCP